MLTVHIVLIFWWSWGWVPSVGGGLDILWNYILHDTVSMVFVIEKQGTHKA